MEHVDTVTPPSLRALLGQIIDYAGQYPPADLSLEEALRNFARYRRHPDAWMLARFVHPAARLDALAAHAHLFTQAPPFRFSVLGTGGPHRDTFLAAFENDLQAVQAFHTRHADRVLADVMEVRFPPVLIDAAPAEIEDFLDALARQVTLSGLSELALFFEVPLGDAPDTLPPLLAAFAEHNSRQPMPLRSETGLKVRCGGMTPVYGPSPRQLAFAINACYRAGVRFKATAGLHHPLRHHDDAVGETMHGFFNVFAGAALTQAHDFDTAVLQALLEDEHPDHFRFAPDALAWNDYSATIEDIHDARSTLAISFGSCSFDEPREDLRAMGLL